MKQTAILALMGFAFWCDKKYYLLNAWRGPVAELCPGAALFLLSLHCSMRGICIYLTDEETEAYRSSSCMVWALRPFDTLGDSSVSHGWDGWRWAESDLWGAVCDIPGLRSVAWPDHSAMWICGTWWNLEERPPAKCICVHQCFGGGPRFWSEGTRSKELVSDTLARGAQWPSLSRRTICRDCGHGMWENTLSLKCRKESLLFCWVYIFLSVHRNKVYSLHSKASSIQHLMNAWIIYVLGLRVSRLTTIFIPLYQGHFDHGH